jgi:hypothetical protein
MEMHIKLAPGGQGVEVTFPPNRAACVLMLELARDLVREQFARAAAEQQVQAARSCDLSALLNIRRDGN